MARPPSLPFARDVRSRRSPRTDSGADRPRAILFASLLHTLLSACTSPPAAAPAAARAMDPRFEQRDLPAYTPAPGNGAAPGARALTMSGGEEQARRVALSMVAALLESDVATLRSLFEARVVQLPSGRSSPRDELVESCLEKSRALIYEPDLGVDDLLAIDAVSAQSVAAYHEGGPLPPGIRAADFVVILPARAEIEQRNLRSVPCLWRVYVRPGPDARIVGLGR